MIALSTAWRPSPRAKLPTTLKAVRALGCKAVEIGVSGSRFRRKKALKALEKLDLKVRSVHNTCSARRVPRENERGDWLGSPDSDQRQQALEVTRETIAHAEALGARVVVLHMGSPPIEQRHEKRELLIRLTAGGAEAEEEFGVTREEVLAERDDLSPPWFEAACQSLGELLEDDSKVKLGVECRVHYHEVPSISETERMLERFDDPRLGYWHDTGHAAMQGAMGLADPLDWLRRFGSRTIGVHLHDVVRRERLIDHFPPGLGHVDFEAIRELVPMAAIPVMEVSANFLAEEVAMGLEHLRRVGF